MYIYKAAILGSGYFSIGFHLTEPDSIILEKNYLCDMKYYATFNGFTYFGYTPKNKLCNELLDSYKTLGMITSSSFNTCLSEAALCSFIRDKNCNILLGTDCMSVEPENDYYCITIYNSAGVDKIYAYNIIDTRPLAPNNCLNLLFECENDLSDKIFESDKAVFSVSKAFYNNSYLLKTVFNTEIDINFAKKEIYEAFRQHLMICDAKVFVPAYSMYRDTHKKAKQISSSYILADELFFDSAPVAFDMGIELAKEMMG